jgi:hypothetical protein
MSDLLALLDQLDEARAKATPGPWHWDQKFGEKNDTGLALTNDAGAEIVGAYNTHCCDFRDDPTVEDTDAALIVAAVNALPKLTAALRRVVERAEREVKDAEAGARYAAEVDQTVLLRSEEARAYAWRTVQSLLTAALTPEQVQP